MTFKPIADHTNGFYIPCVSLFGPGCSKEIGNQAKELGAKKALIVTDEGLFKAGVADILVGYLDETGVSSHVYAGAEPNPTDKNVHDGVSAYEDNGCDFIISLGGGSSHDCAKGIGLVTAGGGHIRDYEGVNQSKVPMTPLISVNTTAGTASEMTRFCIITNTETMVKMAIVDWRCTPLIAINDPRLMVAKPAGLTAATGMDALTHAIEAYVSTAANPITDACAEKAIRMIQQWLRQAVANGENIEAREAMSYAQYLAGMAFNNASLGYVHAMAHQLGGFYKTCHMACVMQCYCHMCVSLISSLVQSVMPTSLACLVCIQRGLATWKQAMLPLMRFVHWQKMWVFRQACLSLGLKKKTLRSWQPMPRTMRVCSLTHAKPRMSKW